MYVTTIYKPLGFLRRQCKKLKHSVLLEESREWAFATILGRLSKCPKHSSSVVIYAKLTLGGVAPNVLRTSSNAAVLDINHILFGRISQNVEMFLTFLCLMKFYLLYRLTIQVVPNLLMTSKLVLCFSICSLL